MSDENQTSPSPGQMLKEARERLGLSINDVATSTKINPNVLRSLEAGQLDELPARTFVRGFVRSYAQYLKIDPTPIIQAFGLEDPFISSMGQSSGEENENPRAEKKSSDFNAASLGPRVLLLAGIITLILMIIGIKRVVDKYAKETIPPVTAQTESGTPIISSPEVEAKAAAEAEAQAIADAVLADDPALAGLVAKKSEAEKTAEPTLEPTAVPTAVPTALPTAAPTAIPTAVPTVVPTAAPEKEQPTPAPKKPVAAHEIILEASEEVEVEVSLDSGRSKDYELNAGDVRTFKANKLIKLEIDNGGAINIIYNGQDLGLAGKAGKSIDLKFPKQ